MLISIKLLAMYASNERSTCVAHTGFPVVPVAYIYMYNIIYNSVENPVSCISASVCMYDILYLVWHSTA